MSDADAEIFEIGDWVSWAFEPNDPNGPYAWMIRENRLRNGNGPLNGDPINDRLVRYKRPPYLVVQVFPVSEEYLDSVGHTQYVRVKMYRRPPYGSYDEKIRTFSGKLFKKVPPPRRKK